MDVYGPYLVIILSVFVMIILSHRSFTQEEVSFNGGFVSPSLLTNRFSLGWGFVVYFFLVMLAYTVITYYWGPLSVIISPFVQGTDLEKLTAAGDKTPRAIVPIVVAVGAAVALSWDAKYNPFGIILKFAHDLIRVPDKALTTLEQLKLAKFRRLASADAASIAADEDILECEESYFNLDRKTLLYRWAHLCHLRYLLIGYLRVEPKLGEWQTGKRGRAAQVITELNWADLDKSYRDLAPRFGSWRKSADRDPDEAIEIFSAINELKERHYRVLACLIVCMSGNEREVWEQLQSLSEDPVNPIPGNVALYLTLFCVNLFASILIGRELATFLYLHFIGSSDKIQNLDVERLKFWFLVSLVIFFTPIVLMFLFRRVMHDQFPFKEKRHWALYASFGVLAFIMAILVLPELPYNGPRPEWFSGIYWNCVWASYLWGLTPCFLTGMVAYRMDSPAGCKDLTRNVFLDRAKIASVCALVSGLFSFLGAVGAENLSNSERFVVVFTVTLLGATTGWLSRFKTDSYPSMVRRETGLSPQSLGAQSAASG